VAGGGKQILEQKQFGDGGKLSVWQKAQKMCNRIRREYLDVKLIGRDKKSKGGGGGGIG
jgi:hypothetical protein